MTRGPKPKLAPFHHRRPAMATCKRGHALAGYNAKPRGRNSTRNGNPTCRACGTAFQWARRNHLFYDDPRVIERANQLIEQYQSREDAS